MSRTTSIDRYDRYGAAGFNNNQRQELYPQPYSRDVGANHYDYGRDARMDCHVLPRQDLYRQRYSRVVNISPQSYGIDARIDAHARPCTNHQFIGEGRDSGPENRLAGGGSEQRREESSRVVPSYRNPSSFLREREAAPSRAGVAALDLASGSASRLMSTVLMRREDLPKSMKASSSYTAQNSINTFYELSYAKGEILQVLRREDKDWYDARNSRGVMGRVLVDHFVEVGRTDKSNRQGHASARTPRTQKVQVLEVGSKETISNETPLLEVYKLRKRNVLRSVQSKYDSGSKRNKDRVRKRSKRMF